MEVPGEILVHSVHLNFNSVFGKNIVCERKFTFIVNEQYPNVPCFFFANRM